MLEMLTKETTRAVYSADEQLDPSIRTLPRTGQTWHELSYCSAKLTREEEISPSTPLKLTTAYHRTSHPTTSCICTVPLALQAKMVKYNALYVRVYLYFFRVCTQLIDLYYGAAIFPRTRI